MTRQRQGLLAKPGSSQNSVEVAVLQALFAVALLTANRTSLKFLDPAVPAVQATFLLYLFGAVFAGAVLLVRHERRQMMRPQRDAFLLNAARAVFAAVTAILLILALRSGSIAGVTTLFYSKIVFLLVLSRVFLGERGSPADWLTAAICILGVVVIVQPENLVTAQTLLLVLGAALSSAALQLLLKPAAAVQTPILIYFNLSLFSSALLLIFAVQNWVTPSLADLGFLAFSGLASCGSQVLLARAYSAAPASALAPVDASQMVFAVGVGLLLFQEELTLAMAFGMALIAGGIVYGGLRRRSPSA